jgi:TolA-binding protein
MTTREVGRWIGLTGGTALLLTGGLTGCAYFNTLYNARLKFREAQEILERSDPERKTITKQEETLYTESFEKAAKVVKYHPDSRWVDDALLLMGKASFEKGDYSTALRKFEEILVFFPDSKLVGEAHLNKGRSLIATREFAEAREALTRAAAIDRKDLRDDVVYFLGLVHYEQENREKALESFTEVVERHRKSPWFADAGMKAGEISESQGDPGLATSFYERVRARGRTPEERYRGGMRKGEVLLAHGEFERAKTTFHDVSRRSTNEDDQAHALVMKGRAAAAAGDNKEATRTYDEVIEKFPRSEAAGEAQLAIASIQDGAGDLVKAKELYELVKDQGTGHPAWQEASSRISKIQRVLDLREEIAAEDVEEKEHKRYLLAEQLLEKIGDVDAALSEYESLADDAFRTEWGARALYAQAWLLEHRLDRPDTAEALLHRLANYYSGTPVDAYARQRLGYPIWKVEKLEPPKVVFIRPEGEGATPSDIAVNRVPPRDVPLPAGVDRVRVWARLHIDDDGSVEKVKIVKSAGDEIDAAVVEAASASSFLSPSEGGSAITVLEYSFPPEDEIPGEDVSEPTADDRDAALDTLDARDAALGADAGTPGDSLAATGTPAPSDSLAAAGTGRAAPDSSAAPGDSLPATETPAPSDSLAGAETVPVAVDSSAAPADSVPERAREPQRRLRDREY